ncbi:MAG: hypothetical protein GTN70_01775, partial [Deltaproteobacteria bacterium]|nr:hypothetical protein [Deltaproteobacteria bacterium]NIS76376.1 hypothetical protein [Deltaproteobacteria bacterium]
SHTKQMKILFNLFDIDHAPEEEKAEAREPVEKAEIGERPLEFDLVIPMREDAEVIAAKVVEEITHFKDVDRDTVDRIKMAIIEACINSFEHSEAEDGLVKLRYVIADDKLEVFVTDEGKGFKVPKSSIRREARGKNRGWGLKIIKELVDDVEILTGDRGTTIRMIKYFDLAAEDDFEEKSKEREGDPQQPSTPDTEEGGDSGTET